jgi:hypothetical protein
MRLTHWWQRIVVVGIGVIVMIVAWPSFGGYAGFAMLLAYALVAGIDEGGVGSAGDEPRRHDHRVTSHTLAHGHVPSTRPRC